MPGTRRVVDYLVESLAAIGVDHIFGVDGGHCSGRMGVIAGDGAFLVHGGEAHTAVHYRLPVAIGLFNNNAQNVCVNPSCGSLTTDAATTDSGPARRAPIRQLPGRCARRSMSTPRPLSALNARPMTAKTSAKQQIPTA
jgi:thiamine pyrophosphate-dependent acetolactate synthase large subunit-like protein